MIHKYLLTYAHSNGDNKYYENCAYNELSTLDALQDFSSHFQFVIDDSIERLKLSLRSTKAKMFNLFVIIVSLIGFTVSSINPYYSNNNHYYQFSSPFEYEAPYLNSRINYDVPSYSSSNYKGHRSFDSCDKFIEYQRDYHGGYVGILNIPDPDIPKSETRIVLTVASQLNSVSLFYQVLFLIKRD